ncbi:MAG: peptidylprolyl isomerase, partial [Bacteroidota bacterium]
MRVFGLLLFIGIQMGISQFDYQSKALPVDTVATVGTQAITGKDFLERFELMPWPKKELKSRIEQTKMEFLQSFIAEKLLAMEAVNQNIGTDSATLSMQNNLERMFVRDEFYKREVLPKIVVSNREIQQGLQRYAREMEVEILAVLSKQNGEALYQKVVRSKSKNKTLRSLKDALYVPLDTVQVNFGSDDLQFEEAVYSAGTDSLSKPFESKSYGWIMVHILGRRTNQQYASLSRPDQIHKVNKIISGRKEDSLATKAFAAVTGSQRAEANPGLFLMIADSAAALLRADSLNYRTKNLYTLPPSAVALVESKFAGRLSEPFITIENGAPMTLGEVFTGLSDNNIVFPNLQTEYIRWVLNNNIKTVIQNELLAREGLKKNLNQTEPVRHDIATWMDNRRASLLLRQIVDTISVSAEEIESEYQLHPLLYGATMMVRLREILVDSVALAKSLKERLNRGEDFAALASRYSKRKEWAKRGGESGFIDVSKWGELGAFASSAKIGEIEGPWRIRGGLTIFEVLERKIIDDSIRNNFSDVRKTIEQKVLQEKRRQTVNRYIGSLAKKYNVTIDEEALRKIPTTTTSMFTWRNIGFG